MRAGWAAPDTFHLLLTALMPENRLALRVSEATGLRIGDVLGLRTEQVARGQRFSVLEQKTGKARRIYVPIGLWREMMETAGRRYVFEGRLDWRKHRSRSAVFKDLRRVCALYRLDGRRIAAHLSPHSARKIYAVEAYHKSRDLKKVQALLNHSDEGVTVLYAMADELEKARS